MERTSPTPSAHGRQPPAPRARTIPFVLEPLSAVARTGTPPPDEVTRAVAARAEEIDAVSPKDLYAILTPAICGRHPDAVLQWLRDAGLLVRILPELDRTVAFSQEGGRRHKDVWEHTKAVVRQSVPRPAVRWAAVLHDIGKVTTRRFLPGGRVTFHGHDIEGVRMFRRGPAKRIAFPRDERRRIELLIRHHLRPGQYDGTWTDSAVRRFARDMDEILDDLLALSRADVTSRRPGKRKRCLYAISELAARIRTLREEDARPKPLPAGLGNHLMAALDLPPGKHIGELRERLEALVQEGRLEAGREPDYYVEAVRGLGLCDGLEIRPPRGFAR